jgi:adenine-specific DNA-methyltransferase
VGDERVTVGTRIQLVWPNKDKFLLSPKDDSGKPAWVERDHLAAREVRLTDFVDSVGVVNEADPYLDNLLFTGDSFDVLRVLTEVPEFRQNYRGRVKTVYVDPPFNTGQTFAHYDDWMEHSTWLSFMRERLLLLKELLAVDGSIWIHLDDAEAHRMRCLLDEVFGANCFVANVIWQRVDNARARSAQGIVPAHDFILVYSKTPGFQANKEILSDGLPAHYDRVDELGRAYCSRQLRKTGSSAARTDRPSMWFSMTAPDGTVVWPIRADGSEGRWQWGQAKVETDEHLLDWRRNRSGGWEPFMRIYPAEEMTVPFTTWWPYGEVGSNRVSKLELRALFPSEEILFATPKPERLLERIIHIASKPGDIVLDVFAGSGTTAAVAHKMGRRWVTAEILPETVATFTQPRLEKVVNGEDAGGITESTSWVGGGGFRTVIVAPSMYEATPLGVMLAAWATNGRFARAISGQLGFEWQTKKHAPFCGARGRMRLAVFDGAVGVEEARHVVSLLRDTERVTIVAKVVLSGVEELLTEISRGSRVRKAPRDVLTGKTRASRRADRDAS